VLIALNIVKGRETSQLEFRCSSQIDSGDSVVDLHCPETHLLPSHAGSRQEGLHQQWKEGERRWSDNISFWGSWGTRGQPKIARCYWFVCQSRSPRKAGKATRPGGGKLAKEGWVCVRLGREKEVRRVILNKKAKGE